MEDAATAEISRAQLWQWLNNNVVLDTGKELTVNLFESIVIEECDKIKDEIGEKLYSNGKFDLATSMFTDMIKNDNFDEFLTLPAYKYI